MGPEEVHAFNDGCVQSAEISVAIRSSVWVPFCFVATEHDSLPLNDGIPPPTRPFLWCGVVGPAPPGGAVWVGAGLLVLRH